MLHRFVYDATKLLNEWKIYIHLSHCLVIPLMDPLACLQLIESRISTFQPALKLSCCLDLLYAAVSKFLNSGRGTWKCEIPTNASAFVSRLLMMVLMRMARLHRLVWRTQMKVRKRMNRRMPWKQIKKAATIANHLTMLVTSREVMMTWVLIDKGCSLL